MGLGDNYCTRAELKTRLGITDTNDDAVIDAACTAASRNVEKYCRRQFNDAGVETARKFYPLTSRLVVVDDFWDTTNLVVTTDDGDDGTYDTTWTLDADYQVEPLNGVKDGVPGWAYWKIRAIDSAWFPAGRRPTVQVSARWGWQTVPEPVKEGTKALAEEIFKMKDSPYGVAGFGEFGMVRIRENPKIVSLLMNYRRDAVRVR